MAYLETGIDVPNRWLLIQTLATAASRRRLLATLGVQAGWRILDVGTGFGSTPMESAVLAPVDAMGIDADESMVDVTEAVRIEAAKRGCFVPGSRVTFLSGDAYALSHPDASFDLATARFVFQHLRNPAGAASELARVVKPGGLACLVDVDDGLSVTYPEPSADYRRLAEALTAMQERAGGGRHVARTLPARLDAAGFDVLGVHLIPVAQYRSSQPGDVNRTFLVERFRTARSDMVGQFISEDECDECLNRFAAEIVPAECVAGAHLAIIGRRR